MYRSPMNRVAMLLKKLYTEQAPCLMRKLVLHIAGTLKVVLHIAVSLHMAASLTGEEGHTTLPVSGEEGCATLSSCLVRNTASGEQPTYLSGEEGHTGSVDPGIVGSGGHRFEVVLPLP